MSSFVKPKTRTIDDSVVKNDSRESNTIRQKVLSSGLSNRYPSNIFIKPQGANDDDSRLSSNRPSTEVVVKRSVFKNTNVVEKVIEPSDINQIEFTFMSEEEILNGSVCEITDTKLGGPNSLYDLRMGPISAKDICETCEEKWEVCPGHFGHIKLAIKIPHPLLYKKILEYLRIFCMDCKLLAITDERLKILGINKIKKDNRFKKVLADVSDNIDSCMHCKSKIANYSFLDDKYIKELNGKKLPVSYDEIAKLFDNIREMDLIKIGIDPKKIHPSHYVISNLLVVPTCVRPPITRIEDAGQNHDDLTYKYIDILKVNKKLSETTNENTIYHLTNGLTFHIKTLFNNSKGKAKDLQGRRAIKCIKKRISGKTGYIRKYIQGKRAHFCARTVIGPEANCMVDELVVPTQMSKILTYPVVVNEINMSKCQEWMDQEKINCIIRDEKKILPQYACWTLGTALEHNDIILRDGKTYNYEKMIFFNKNFVLQEGDKIIRKKIVSNTLDLISSSNSKDKNIRSKNDPRGSQQVRVETQVIDVQLPKRKPFQLQIGDTVERQLQDGDWVVLNRQPTLWKGSMRAKKIVIRPGKTFRFNLASTAAFNADRQ